MTNDTTAHRSLTTILTGSIPKLLVMGLLLAAPPAYGASLLMISVDGMRSEYVLQGRAHGLKLPTFDRFMSRGTYADGVLPPVPSISWPGAVTMMTGTAPAQHGVYANERFDVQNHGGEDVYWYASDVKADTLWDAAARAGMVTANVDQLGTVGTTSVRYDIPRYQPSKTAMENLKATEAVSRPANFLPELEAKLGPYIGIDFSKTGYDRSRTQFALEILRRYKPQFMTVHLSSVDVNGHEHGPFSDEANRAVEAADGLIAQLQAAALANDPDAVVVVVSDHGMARIDHQINLRVPFVEAGLIKIDPPMPGRPVHVTDWQADIWSGGGSAAIMLKNPQDAAVRAKVAEVLHRLAADPANGISRIIEGSGIRELNGWPQASFVVDLKPGTAIGGNYIGNKLVTYPSSRGTHGYLPVHPEMHASFFIMGKGIKAGQNLGIVDMRQVAPTLAQALGVKLKSATQPALPVFAGQAAGR